MINGVDEADVLISEETKLNFPETCTCSLCESDYKYFYLCSHGSIITVCNECGAIYDPVYEAGLSNDEHNLHVSRCFKGDCAPATMKNLEDAGLKDLVNKFGLLDDEEF
jgi:hypothetical protein